MEQINYNRKIEKKSDDFIYNGKDLIVEKIKKGTEISPQLENNKYVLYHGTRKVFEKFKTPTGLEKMDIQNGGVVYLTSDISVAKKYAGDSGYVAKVFVDNLKSYKDALEEIGRTKQNKYVRNVYVNLPEDIEITYFIPANKIKVEK